MHEQGEESFHLVWFHLFQRKRRTAEPSDWFCSCTELNPLSDRVIIEERLLKKKSVVATYLLSQWSGTFPQTQRLENSYPVFKWSPRKTIEDLQGTWGFNIQVVKPYTHSYIGIYQRAEKSLKLSVFSI